MEARIPRLESDVAHLRWEVGEMKADLRRLRDKVAAIEERICNYGVSRLKSRRRDPIDLPLLLMFLLITGILFAAMSHGFGWI